MYKTKLTFKFNRQYTCCDEPNGGGSVASSKSKGSCWNWEPTSYLPGPGTPYKVKDTNNITTH